MTTDSWNGCIGIDLGTTNSCVAVWDSDHVQIIPNRQGNNTTPSCVYFAENGQIVVGRDAKKKAGRNSDRVIYAVKRMMGKRFGDDQLQDDLENLPYIVEPDLNDLPRIRIETQTETNFYKPEQISAIILEHMRDIASEYLGTSVKQAVITVPAYFNESQRRATRNAATIAGLDCLKIINEPTSACLCYGLNKKLDDAKVLVFDLGGGTFDVSLLSLDNGIFQVLATNGDAHLGGEDFDIEITNYLIEEFLKSKTYNPDGKLTRTDFTSNGRVMRKLLNAAEEAKRVLSSAESAEIEIESLICDRDFYYLLSRTKFQNICQGTFNRCLEPVHNVLADAKIEPDGVDEVVLVGGSTRIPRVQEMLSELFGGKQLNKSIHPDEAVAYGAAVQGAIMANSDDSEKTRDLLLLDVNPISLGIESRGGIMSTVIERNTPVPVKKTKTYSTVEDGQQEVLIQIFEGERQFTRDNHKIGDFNLTGIPKQARGVPKIDVTFAVDTDGILTVKAVDQLKGNVNHIEISDSTRLDQEEINQMIDQASKFRLKDEMRRSALNARLNFESYLEDIQKVLNDPSYIKNDQGVDILTSDESNWLNTYILNSLHWLVSNDDLEKDKIEQAQSEFKNTSNPILSKIFVRAKQKRLQNIYAESEKELDDTDIEKVAHEMLGN